MVVDFKDIADTSRLWIYQLNRVLTPLEKDYLANQTSSFLESWAAHGTGLVAAFSIVERRFLFIAADESKANASGCSIDSLTHFLQDMQQQMKIDFFDRSTINYNIDGEIKSMPFIEFRDKLASGDLSSETYMYNTVLKLKSQLKEQFLIPVKDSWLM